MKRHFSYFGTWLCIYAFSTFIWAILSSPVLTIVRLCEVPKGTEYLVGFFVGIILQGAALGIAVGRLSLRENGLGRKKSIARPLLHQLLAGIAAFLPPAILPGIFELCPNTFLWAEGTLGNPERLASSTLRLLTLGVIGIYAALSLIIYSIVKILCDNDPGVKRLRAEQNDEKKTD